MIGPAEGEEESFTHQLRGVIPRAFEYLFSLINREQEKVYYCACLKKITLLRIYCLSTCSAINSHFAVIKNDIISS